MRILAVVLIFKLEYRFNNEYLCIYKALKKINSKEKNDA